MAEREGLSATGLIDPKNPASSGFLDNPVLVCVPSLCTTFWTLARCPAETKEKADVMTVMRSTARGAAFGKELQIELIAAQCARISVCVLAHDHRVLSGLIATDPNGPVRGSGQFR